MEKALTDIGQSLYSMMMVVMMMPVGFFELHVTTLLVAVLALALQFKRCVANAVLTEFFAYGILHRVVVGIRHDMHRSVIVLSVHAPHVDMMHVDDAVDL